jgi:hypothetical protein
MPKYGATCYLRMTPKNRIRDKQWRSEHKIVILRAGKA